MLNCITGQPGDGKTLYTITKVIEYIEECNSDKNTELHNRPVWYYGINQVAPHLGWQELKDPKFWVKCPKGSIIIIDEAQEHFPPQKQGSERPEHFKRFATHRHSGYDIYLITQNAMNIDFRVRSMVNVHWHLSRKFGMPKATVYRFTKVQNPDDYFAKKEAIVSTFNYPEKNFDLYKSAEVHTHKKTLPWKQIILYSSIFMALVAVCFYIYSVFAAKTEKYEKAETTEQVVINANTTTQKKPANIQTSRFDPSQYVPEYKDLPYTAPVYDHLVQVRDYPKIDGCFSMTFNGEVECTCNDQQGNYVEVSLSACEYFIEKGFFDFTKTNYDSARRNTSASGAGSPRIVNTFKDR